jgi:riboflavin synthase
MFSGIVETVGTVVEVRPAQGSCRLVVASDLPVDRMHDGESVAVDGVCLTVVRREGDRFHADVVEETLRRSTLGECAEGRRVNLERALRLGDRLGGHLVQGHVDATTAVLDLTRRGADVRLRAELPAELRGLVARKGSVALHGVSLTVSAVDDDAFEVALVPHTLARTTLGGFAAGGRLNLEVDLLARYLERLVLFRRSDG